MKNLTDKLAGKAAVSKGMTNDQKEVVSYGMQALFQMIILCVLSLAFGILTNTVIESLVVFLTVGNLRRFTGGVHADSMLACICISMITIMAMSSISFYLLTRLNDTLGIIVLITAYIYIFVCVYKLAPVAAPNKPITKPEKIARLKKGSRMFILVAVAISAVLIFVNIIFKDKAELGRRINSVNFAFAFALVWQSFTLTPLAHKCKKILTRK